MINTYLKNSSQFKQSGILNPWTGPVDSGSKPRVKTFHKVTDTRVVRVHPDGEVIVPKLDMGT